MWTLRSVETALQIADSICYLKTMDTVQLAREAHTAQQKIEEGRQQLVNAVRSAYRAGMSQRAIAQVVGRSQPEVSRIIHFHGTSPHGRVLRERRAELIDYFEEHGVDNVRVFGSVATGQDKPTSDIDLLVTAHKPLGLLAQSRLQAEATQILGAPVDIVFDHAIRPDVRDRIVNEAVLL